jgi:hypothetical protein
MRSVSSRKQDSRLTSAWRRWRLGLSTAALSLSACAHGVTVVAPPPCKAMTNQQILAVGSSVDEPMIEIVEAYEHHCCVDDALASRVDPAVCGDHL